MNPVLTAVIVLCAIGIVCALMLVIAAKYMSVPVDEKFPAIRECLPGANCGACGYAGCDGYANALASGSEKKINKCVAGAQDAARALSAVTGIPFEAVAEVNAFVQCRGDCLSTGKKAEFDGAKSCAAAKLVFGGDGACAYGCLGYGDCASVCPEHAINIINGVAHINDYRCMGCGACAKTCPQGIIMVYAKDIEIFPACSNREKGVNVRKACTAGCIGCGLCAKKCPNGAITMENNLPIIDHEKCAGCGTCVAVCPSHAILKGNKV